MRQSIVRALHGAMHWFKYKIKRNKKPRVVGNSAGDFTTLLPPREILEEEAAAPCWRCTDTAEAEYGVHAQVYHVDLLPGVVTLFIFAALPHKLQLKVIYLKLTRRHPEPVVAAAVADPRIFGYSKLYQILLTRSQRELVSALRLLLCDDHLPVLIHCIHGKDRTGLVVMLIYLLCGVPHNVIVRDYAQSESLLREGRDNRQLLNMPEEITTDEIIASQAHIMEDTIAFLHDKYGDVTEYLRQAGMRHDEIIALRRILQDDKC
jgi:Tyrosine phosphatase family